MILKDLQEIGTTSSIGKGYSSFDSINEIATITELNDVYAKDLSDGTLYYIVDGKIYSLKGSTSIGEELVQAEEKTGADGEFKYIELANGVIQITRYIGSKTNVVIPAEYDGYKVYSVGNINATADKTSRYNIFGETNSSSNTTVKNIEISEGIKEIGVAAFSKCTGLTGTLTLPSTITEIGAYAFFSCAGLTGDLVIPEGVTKIQNSSFGACSGFDGTLTLPSTLKVVEYASFYQCTNLTGDLVIPEGVTIIDQYAFGYCQSLDGTLTLPTTLTEIGQFAFNRCELLTGDLTIPEGVTKIGNAAFQVCEKLDGKLTLPSTLTEIGTSVFNHCSSLTNTSLVIPKSLKIIGREDSSTHTFYDFATKTIEEYVMEEESEYYKVIDGVLLSKDGTRIVAYPANKVGNTYEIPEGVTIIDELAFSRAGSSYSSVPDTGLKKIILPNSYILTTSVPSYYLNSGNNLALALYVHTGVEEIEVKEDNSNYKTDNGILYSKDGTTLWYVPTAKTGEITILEGVTTIKGGAFYGTNRTQTITIPASVTEIDAQALTELNKIKSKVTFAEGCVYQFNSSGSIVKQ